VALSESEPADVESDDNDGEVALNVLSGAGIRDAEELALTAASDIPAALTSTPDDFIRTFSRINIVKAWKPLEKVGFLSIGGSRDTPTRFKFNCPNASFGCKSTLFTQQELDHHVSTCTLTSEEEHLKLIADDSTRKFMCTRENCTSKGFKTRGELNDHVKKVHDTTWTPKPCHCDPDKLYKSGTAWRNHQRSAHGDFSPQMCGYPGCKHDKTFTNLSTLFAHMKTKHLLNRVAAKPYIQGKTTEEA